MKRIVFVFASIASFAISCTVNPDIFPDPSSVDAGPDASSSSSSSSSSSASSSSSSSSGMPLPGDVSGTRLKLYSLTSADGFSFATGAIYDSLLSANCTPFDTPSGKRCVVYDSLATPAAFADAACTVPGVFVGIGCAAPVRVARFEATSGMCGTTTQYRVFDAGPKAPFGYFLSGNNCTQWSANDMNAYSMYAIGAEVDYTQFAAMTLEHE